MILVHAPKRTYYEETPAWGAIPTIDSEIALVEMYGAKVIAVALNTEHCTTEEAEEFKTRFEKQLGIPVILPLLEGCKRIVPHIKNLLSA